MQNIYFGGFGLYEALSIIDWTGSYEIFGLTSTPLDDFINIKEYDMYITTVKSLDIKI